MWPDMDVQYQEDAVNAPEGYIIVKFPFNNLEQIVSLHEFRSILLFITLLLIDFCSLMILFLWLGGKRGGKSQSGREISPPEPPLD